QLERHAVLGGLLAQLRFVEPGKTFDATGDLANVPDRFDDVAGARLALAPDHRRSLVDAAKGFTQVASAAHERNVELALVDMELLIRRRQDLALVDVVDAHRLEHLRFDEVS